MIYSDAPLFVNAVLKQEATEAAQRFIAENIRNICTSVLTIDEVAWVVGKNTDWLEATAYCNNLLSGGIMFLDADKQIAREAVAIMRNYGVTPRDAFHAATMRLNGVTEIISEDKIFDKISGIKRVWLK